MAVEALPDPDFVDVRIVDIDLRRTTWSRVHESMRVVFLRLNRAPPDLDWTRLFNEERESRINLRRCGLWIEDDLIGFDCLLHEVEAHHLPDIQRSIDYANRRYREVLGEKISSLPNVANTSTFVVMQAVKDSGAAGSPAALL